MPYAWRIYGKIRPGHSTSCSVEDVHCERAEAFPRHVWNAVGPWEGIARATDRPSHVLFASVPSGFAGRRARAGRLESLLQPELQGLRVNVRVAENMPPMASQLGSYLVWSCGDIPLVVVLLVVPWRLFAYGLQNVSAPWGQTTKFGVDTFLYVAGLALVQIWLGLVEFTDFIHEGFPGQFHCASSEGRHPCLRSCF